MDGNSLSGNVLSHTEYFNSVLSILKEIDETQIEKIHKAGELIGECMKGGGLLHVFSTGHSHMIAEEMFYRSGGLVQVNAILEPALMLHEGAMKSTKMERVSGFAKTLLDSYDIRPGEAILIVSNSGINAVPVEMAMAAADKGMKVIAITSEKVSKELSPRHESGKRLYEIADIAIDNCVPEGDSLLTLPSSEQKVSAVSTIAGAFIAQLLTQQIINEFLSNGLTPPIYMSANLPGGDEHNARLIAKYKERIRCLY